jgi:hypothetical protein
MGATIRTMFLGTRRDPTWIWDLRRQELTCEVNSPMTVRTLGEPSTGGVAGWTRHSSRF